MLCNTVGLRRVFSTLGCFRRLFSAAHRQTSRVVSLTPKNLQPCQITALCGYGRTEDYGSSGRNRTSVVMIKEHKDCGEREKAGRIKEDGAISQPIKCAPTEATQKANLRVVIKACNRDCETCVCAEVSYTKLAALGHTQLTLHDFVHIDKDFDSGGWHKG